ncbi:MAG: hypothetical protein WAK01_16755 [Methylocystis sp.]
MRFLGPQQRVHAQILQSLGEFCPVGSARAKIASAIVDLARLVRLHWIFAIAEISKGLAIMTVGDMAIAEDFGEFVKIAAVSLPEMRGFTRAGAIGIARAAGAARSAPLKIGEGRR